MKQISGGLEEANRQTCPRATCGQCKEKEKIKLGETENGERRRDRDGDGDRLAKSGGKSLHR